MKVVESGSSLLPVFGAAPPADPVPEQIQEEIVDDLDSEYCETDLDIDGERVVHRCAFGIHVIFVMNYGSTNTIHKHLTHTLTHCPSR